MDVTAGLVPEPVVAVAAGRPACGVAVGGTCVALGGSAVAAGWVAWVAWVALLVPPDAPLCVVCAGWPACVPWLD